MRLRRTPRASSSTTTASRSATAPLGVRVGARDPDVEALGMRHFQGGNGSIAQREDGGGNAVGSGVRSFEDVLHARGAPRLR